MRAARQLPVAAQLREQVLRRSLPGELAGDVHAPEAEVVDADDGDRPVGVGLQALPERALGNGPHRPQQHPRPLPAVIAKGAWPHLPAVAESMVGVVEDDEVGFFGLLLDPGQRRLRLLSGCEL